VPFVAKNGLSGEPYNFVVFIIIVGRKRSQLKFELVSEAPKIASTLIALPRVTSTSSAVDAVG
jgi:hypothetical protein